MDLTREWSFALCLGEKGQNKSIPDGLFRPRYSFLAAGKVTLGRYNLPWTEAISNYIDTHTKVDLMSNKLTNVSRRREKALSAHLTAKNSTATAFAWRQELTLKRTLEIQRKCSGPMRRLGYSLIRSQRELDKKELPIAKSEREVWRWS